MAKEFTLIKTANHLERPCLPAGPGGTEDGRGQPDGDGVGAPGKAVVRHMGNLPVEICKCLT